MREIKLKDGELVFANALNYTKSMVSTTTPEKQIFLTGVKYAIRQLKKKGHDV